MQLLVALRDRVEVGAAAFSPDTSFRSISPSASSAVSRSVSITTATPIPR